MLNGKTTLETAKIASLSDIDFLYDMVFSDIDAENLNYEIGDIMAIEAIYDFLNDKPFSEKTETAEHHLYYYFVSTGEAIPVFVPKNGKDIFVEF